MTVQEPGKTFAEVKIVYLKRIPLPNKRNTNPFITSQFEKIIEVAA